MSAYEETDESRADLQEATDTLKRAAVNVAKLATHYAIADASFVRDTMHTMREAVDRVEAQMLARIPSVKP